jgi:hypothetical protein
MIFHRTHVEGAIPEVAVGFDPITLAEAPPWAYAYQPVDLADGSAIALDTIDHGPCRLFHFEVPVDDDHLGPLASPTFSPFGGVYLIRERHHHQDRVRVIGRDGNPDELAGVLLAGYLDEERTGRVLATMSAVGVLPAAVVGRFLDENKVGHLRLLGAIEGTVDLRTADLGLDDPPAT